MIASNLIKYFQVNVETMLIGEMFLHHLGLEVFMKYGRLMGLMFFHKLTWMQISLCKNSIFSCGQNYAKKRIMLEATNLNMSHRKQLRKAQKIAKLTRL